MRHARNPALTGLVLLAAAIAGCGDRDRAPEGDGADTPVAGGVAVYCTVNLPDRLDAFVSNDRFAADLRPILFTPLAQYDTAGGVQPYLARGWEWADQQRMLRLDLRDDIAWHDGRPVTAGDVAWTIRIAADSMWGYLGRGDFRTLADVVATDSTTVEVRFAEPFVADMEPFTRLPILPAHLLDTLSAEAFGVADYHRSPIGSGPFRFRGRTADGAIQLERTADFPEDLGRAFLDRLVLRQLPEVTTEVVELQTGGVDLCIGGSTLGKAVGQSRGIETVSVPPVGVQSIVFDTRKAPFSDARVRRAMSAALDRATIAAVVSPLARPAGNFMPEGSRRWRRPELAQPDADSALAAALLDSAGWRSTTAGQPRTNDAGQPLAFTLLATRSLEPALTVVQSQLRRVGVDALLEFMETASFIGTITRPEARPAAMGLGFIPDQIMLPDPYAELHSSGAQNFASYHNPRVDSLIDRLHDVMPDGERATIYDELQRRIAEDVPMIYTYYFPRVLAVGPRIRGVTADANGPFASATRWWVPGSGRAAPAGDAPADSGASR